MPGKPAARLGDTALNCADPIDTPTGTVVVSACTVFINGLPAAKQGDQIVGSDVHIVNVPSAAGTVPTPLPHAFSGLIDGGLIFNVKIMGKPAAVVGSTATNNPPHIPQGGVFAKPPTNRSQIIAGSPNVFIGSGSGGGGGSGQSGSVDMLEPTIEAPEVEASNVGLSEAESHYLDVSLVDGEKHLLLGTVYKLTDTEEKDTEGYFSGPLRRYGVPSGNGTVSVQSIIKAVWSDNEKLEPGKKVQLLVETIGIEDGTPAEFTIWERDTNTEDKLVTVISDIKIQGNKAQTEWVYNIFEQVGEKIPVETYTKPTYFFTVKVGLCKTRSPILAAQAKIDIQLMMDGEPPEPLADQLYQLFLTTGEVREGKTDGDGWLREEKVPPRKALVVFPYLPSRFQSQLEMVFDPETGKFEPVKPKPEIGELCWEKITAEEDEQVGLSAKITNYAEVADILSKDDPCTFEVFEFSDSGKHKKVAVIGGILNGDILIAKEDFTYPILINSAELKETEGPYPKYFFTLSYQNEVFGNNQESNLLRNVHEGTNGEIYRLYFDVNREHNEYPTDFVYRFSQDGSDWCQEKSTSEVLKHDGATDVLNFDCQPMGTYSLELLHSGNSLYKIFSNLSFEQLEKPKISSKIDVTDEGECDVEQVVLEMMDAYIDEDA